MPMGGTVSVRDACSKCNFDLHSCVNCGHFSREAYNECREPQAERVLDKEKANYCDYFCAHQGRDRLKGGKSKDEYLKRLDGLFK